MPLKDWWENLFYPYRIFTLLAISFLVGLSLANFLDFGYLASFTVFLFILSSLLLLSFLYFVFKIRSLVLMTFAILSLSLGLFYFSYFEYKSAPLLSFDQVQMFDVTVSGRPAVTATSQKLIVSVVVDSKKTKLLLKAPVFPVYQYGDKLEVNGRIIEPEQIKDFDYPGYLKSKGIWGILESEQIVIKGRDDSPLAKVMGILYQTIRRSADLIGRVLPEPHASLASGILLGSQSNASEALQETLTITGLTHIVALSGFNVTIITIMLTWALSGKLGKKRSFWVGLSIVTLFILATGCSSSVVRAGIFSMLILFGTTYGRRADQLNILILAAIAMLLFNPYLMFHDLGFQLSFAAFTGLIYLAPALSDLYLKLFKRSDCPGFVLMVCETLAAQLSVIPIILYNFKTISLISPIANILVVWSIAWIMALTFVLLVFGFIWFPLAKAVAILLWPLLEYVLLVIHYLARIPFASLNFDK